jgi:hypothetical protein
MLKKIDIAGQVVLTVLPLMLRALDPDGRLGYNLLVGLICLGGWQVLSTVIHLPVIKAPWIVKGRMIYCVALLLTGGYAFYQESQHSNPYMSHQAWLLMAGPVMAIFYFIISLKEKEKIEEAQMF